MIHKFHIHLIDCGISSLQIQNAEDGVQKSDESFE
jgi:hypothetical protein